jgi:predicted glycogen debranching enzyme
MIRFESDILHGFESATSREWLETNGIGGFASSSIIGLNTRRYHGLLTAATQPPAGRMVLLSKMEETVVIDGNRFELGSNQYPGTIHPRGFELLRSFRIDPFPTFVYLIEGIEIEKSVFMVHGENTVVIQYRFADSGSRHISLELRPLVAFRDYHSLTHENPVLDPTVQVHGEGMVSIRPYADLPWLHIAHDKSELDLRGHWYRNFNYAIERERGLDFEEDLFNPFTLRIDAGSGQAFNLVASTEVHEVEEAGKLRLSEIERRQRIVAAALAKEELAQTLALAADAYIVGRGSHKTIIAGYHWFTDWGRDTMIALPGLTLVTGRYDAARSILLQFAQHVDRGMLPNRFPDAGAVPEYNTIDATLWYFEAVRAFLQYTGDYDFVKTNLYPVLCDIMDWHVRGTRYGIKMDEDGLLASNETGSQLTWMDARIGDWVVTPRHGKAVEIQALWYNALRVTESIASAAGDSETANHCAGMAGRAQRSFNDLFWNEERNCLFDTVFGEHRDGTMRPNQILAVSLTHSMLPKDRATLVVSAVENHLFTPFGLRSLAPDDSRYRARYEGDAFTRDSSYHQGPVWAWLLGPFITAYIKASPDPKTARDQAQRWLDQFSTHLLQACVGQVSEIFDGDAPHRPRGCAAQAWSVAEVLRALVEDVNQVSDVPAAAAVRA